MSSAIRVRHSEFPGVSHDSVIKPTPRGDHTSYPIGYLQTRDRTGYSVYLDGPASIRIFDVAQRSERAGLETRVQNLPIKISALPLEGIHPESLIDVGED